MRARYALCFMLLAACNARTSPGDGDTGGEAADTTTQSPVADSATPDSTGLEVEVEVVWPGPDRRYPTGLLELDNGEFIVAWALGGPEGHGTRLIHYAPSGESLSELDVASTRIASMGEASSGDLWFVGSAEDPLHGQVPWPDDEGWLSALITGPNLDEPLEFRNADRVGGFYTWSSGSPERHMRTTDGGVAFLNRFSDGDVGYVGDELFRVTPDGTWEAAWIAPTTLDDLRDVMVVPSRELLLVSGNAEMEDVLETDSELFAFDLETGEVDWERVIPFAGMMRAVSDGESIGIAEAVYSEPHTQYFRLLDATDGSEAWSFELPEALETVLSLGPIDGAWLTLSRDEDLLPGLWALISEQGIESLDDPVPDMVVGNLEPAQSGIWALGASRDDAEQGRVVRLSLTP